MSRRAKSCKKLEPLSGAVGKVLDQLGLSGQLAEYRAVTVWDRVVGDKVSRHTKAEWIDQGELLVLVDSHVWIQELVFLKPEIVKKLNAELGQEIVKDIRFLLMGRRKS
jgi:predicted nucleic acid-binding Zn ribbon protein